MGETYLHFVLIRHRQVMLKIQARTSRISGYKRFYGSCVHLVYNHSHDTSRWLWDLLQNTCGEQKTFLYSEHIYCKIGYEKGP